MLITNLFAAVLLLEAGGEGTRGMIAVKEVVINRAHKHNKSINDVLVEPKQFSCCNGKTPQMIIDEADRKYAGFRIYSMVFSLAKSDLETNITKGATHYCRIDCFPKWESKMIHTVTIGKHKFFKEKVK